MRGSASGLTDRIPGGRLVRRAYVLVSGAVIAQIIIVVSSPVLTRVFTPSDFGVFAVFVTLVAIGSVGGALRYEHAIVLPKSDRDGAAILVLTFLLTVATAVVAGLLLLAFGTRLTSVTNVPELDPLLWLVPVALVVAGLYQSFLYWGIRGGEFSRIARSRVWQAGAGSGASIGLGLIGWTVGGLLVGAIVGFAFASLEFGFRLVTQQRSFLSGMRLPDLRRLARRYRRFPQFGLWSGFLNVAVLEIPALFVAGMFGASTAGLFLLARRVIAAPVQSVGHSVHQVFLNEGAEVIRTDPERLESLYWRTGRRLFLLSVGPIVLAAIVAPVAFEIVFGDQWREAGLFVSMLAPMLLAQLVASPLAGTFAIAERQGTELVREVIRLALVLGAFGVAALVDLSARWTILVYGVAAALGYVLIFAVGAREVRRVRDRASRGLPVQLTSAGSEGESGTDEPT